MDRAVGRKRSQGQGDKNAHMSKENWALLSQASVPFAISSLGYGILWNNPGVGRVIFGNNIMSFENYGTKVMDYWFVAGDTPAEIEEAYAKATGTVPIYARTFYEGMEKEGRKNIVNLLRCAWDGS